MSSNSWTMGSNVREITGELPHVSKDLMVYGLPLTMRLRTLELEGNDGAIRNLVFMVPDIAIKIKQESVDRVDVGSDDLPSQSHRSRKEILSVPDKKYFNPYAFRCFNCSKTFTTRYMLKRHEQIHSGSFYCSYLHCGCTYRNQTTLTKHCVTEHGLKLSAGARRLHKVPSWKIENDAKVEDFKF